MMMVPREWSCNVIYAFANELELALVIIIIVIITIITSCASCVRSCPLGRASRLPYRVPRLCLVNGPFEKLESPWPPRAGRERRWR